MGNEALANNNGKLKLNGAEFIVKCVGYSPTPIGEGPGGDYYTFENRSLYERDFPFIRSMGANCIRLWGWDISLDHTDFLDKAYNNGNLPIFIIASYWIDPPPDDNKDIICEIEYREKLKTEFRSMVKKYKNHPAIIMWNIGNELNAPWMHGENLDCLFTLINEMAYEAHQQEGIEYHPVTTALADIDIINTIGNYDSIVPKLDIWGANIYRGATFGSFFNDYRLVSEKKLIILEFGIYAYDIINGDEYEKIGQPYQAQYAESLWEEIIGNSDICIGGSIMEYSDEWWKGINGQPDKPGCPDYNNNYQSTCGYAIETHPDNYSNEEWWGIMKIKDNGDEPDIKEPRLLYYTLQKLWTSYLYPFMGKKLEVDDSANQNPNGIIDENEQVVLRGSLSNISSTIASNVKGKISTLDAIEIIQSDAIYGYIEPGQTAQCSQCYSIIAHSSNRPYLHWDFKLVETIFRDNYSPSYFIYNYHIGNSFFDVQVSNIFYSYIETLLHYEIASGCKDYFFCPVDYVRRDQMSKFICKSMQKLKYNSCIINECTELFGDVPFSNLFCQYIEGLHQSGIVNGCKNDPLLYCPANFTKRKEMAKFICKAMQETDPGSCITSYCTEIFNDVPSSNLFCSYIESLYIEGVVSGCSVNMFCPDNYVRRSQMAKFIVKAFNFNL